MIIIDSKGRTCPCYSSWYKFDAINLSRLDGVSAIRTPTGTDLMPKVGSDVIALYNSIQAVMNAGDIALWYHNYELEGKRFLDNVYLYLEFTTSTNIKYTCTQFTEKLIGLKAAVAICQCTTDEQMLLLATEYDNIEVEGMN